MFTICMLLSLPVQIKTRLEFSNIGIPFDHIGLMRAHIKAPVVFNIKTDRPLTPANSPACKYVLV